MAIPDAGATRLIRNPDSKNLFYVPQDEFPIDDDSGLFTFERVNPDGTFYVKSGSSDRTECQLRRMRAAAPIASNIEIALYKGEETDQYSFESAYMEAPNTYTVTYHDPSGTYQDVTHSDASVGAPTPAPPSWTRPGYELAGWTPELAETVTESVTYQAIWLTEGATQSPVTLGQARAWADANGYQSGTALAEADKMLLTYDQLAAMSAIVRLPEGYTELEYVEGTGTQYIDTGFAASGDTRVVCKFAVDYIDPTTVGSCPVYGASTNYNVNAFEFWSLSYGFASYDNQDYQDGFGLQANVATVVDQNKNVVTVGGVQKSFSAAAFTTPYTMLVFATHRADAIKIADSTQNLKIYEMQIYDNGTQVRGFVPAKRNSDGAVGMYDTVSRQFYGNSGTGSFVAGPAIQTGDPMAADGSSYVTLEQFREWASWYQASQGPDVEIVSWADGTDEQIAAMVAAADAGKIVLSDYWHEGDTRTVHLSAMSGSVSNANESHAAQDVQFVLTDPGHYTLSNGKKCNFVVLQKDCLKEYGVMNSQNTNSGGWNGCPRRTWCNSVYRNAIPATLRPIFKQFTTYAANGTGSTSAASSDYFALFSEKEIFGSTTYANSSAESKNSQLTWFKTSSNRIKRVNGSADLWRERSPRSGYSNSFCGVIYSGGASWVYANGSYGLAPFGCI